MEIRFFQNDNEFVDYRAVDGRLAVHFDSMSIRLNNIDIGEFLNILEIKGFKLLDINIISLARDCVGKSKYLRGARLKEAPNIFDCSSMIKWLYAQKGIWLPRRSIQQSNFGWGIDKESLLPSDVIFVSGRINYYENDAEEGIGHVGIFTDKKTVIHAANSKIGIVETSIDDFVAGGRFRRARRYLSEKSKTLTLQLPMDREVETSDDLRWIFLQTPKLNIF